MTASRRAPEALWAAHEHDPARQDRLEFARLCLGTMNFGPETDEQTSFEIMDAALEAGVNFFDTANVYGGAETEQIIGRWFAQGGERREKTVIATKVYGGRDPWPNTSRLSALHIRQACDASLRRLQTDHIDLYQMHHIDRDTPWDEIWQAMDLLIQQGKVIYVGSSNFAGWQIVQANETANAEASLGLGREQSLYNLNARTVELEVLPACQAYGLGVIPWSPLGGGLLGGALRKITEGRRASERIPIRIDAPSQPARGSGRPCAPSSVSNPPTLRWLGCFTNRRSPLRSSDLAPSSSSTALARASISSSTPDTLDAARQDLPRARRRRTRGVRLVAAPPARPAVDESRSRALQPWATSRSRPQNLHTLAARLMVSAQNGHALVGPSSAYRLQMLGLRRLDEVLDALRVRPSDGRDW